MPIAVSVQKALENRTANSFPEVNTKPFHRRLYFGSEPAQGGTAQDDKKALPQAYLIEQAENSTVLAHFHDTNQFQVFVQGDGAFGKKPFDGLLVHYAKAHTTYGPIAAGPNGAHYLTLRNNWDSGAKLMPKNRDKLRRIKREHRVAENIHVPDIAALRSVTLETVDLIPLERDGLGARQFNIGPGRACTVAFETDGAGAYAVIVAGSVVHDGAELETQSLIYRGADEAPLTVEAGAEGASVLLLQFPPEPDDE